MPCGKDVLAVNKKPLDQKKNCKIFKGRFKRKRFWICVG